MFECRGCEAKTDEIQHLRAIITEQQQALEKAQQRVMELAEPGVNRRIARHADAPAEPPPPRAHRPQFPGYEVRPEPMIELAEGES